MECGTSKKKKDVVKSEQAKSLILERKMMMMIKMMMIIIYLSTSVTSIISRPFALQLNILMGLSYRILAAGCK
jgi:hypothetical protein